MAAKQQREISTISAGLLDTFDEAAQDWGWQSDQGTGDRVAASEEKYNQASNDLTKRILYLERQVNSLKEKVKQLGG